MKAIPRSFWFVCTALLLLFLAIASQYARLTPAWQVPDEPAHYNYVRQLAESGLPPVIENGDWDQDYLSKVVSEKFPDNLPLSAIEYEDHQPPLYYYLQTPFYQSSAGNLDFLRLVSVLLGGGLVVTSALAAYQLLGSTALAISTAAIIAFIPQHIAMLSGLNNDSLAELLLAIGILLVLHYNRQVKPTRFTLLSMGLVLGLIFLTKSTVYLLAGGVFLLLWQKARQEGFTTRQWVTEASWIFLPALALGLVWWGRNLWVYGQADFLGLQAHNRVVVGQPLTADGWMEKGGWAFALGAAQTTWQSFWGQFGWMAVPMPTRIYQLLGGWVIALLGGLYLRPQTRRSLAQQRAFWFLLSLAGLAILQFLYYNLTFIQHQGRYLYPGLFPFALLLVLGADGWSQWLWQKGSRWLPAGWRTNGWLIQFWQWLPVVFPLYLAVLSAWALVKWVQVYL
jgi:4-amino-4-deoxy-L-arabinose transferase-like glycosyltransferase